jgi:hypothetical protein
MSLDYTPINIKEIIEIVKTSLNKIQKTKYIQKTH